MQKQLLAFSFLLLAGCTQSITLSGDSHYCQGGCVLTETAAKDQPNPPKEDKSDKADKPVTPVVVPAEVETPVPQVKSDIIADIAKPADGSKTVTPVGEVVPIEPAPIGS